MLRGMDFEIPGSDDRPLRGTQHGSDHAPLVLILHGFKGFRAWGMFPWLAERIAAAGFRAIRLDFSHNGVEERDFDRLDLFLLDTWTRHQEDLRAVADHFPGPLALVGHSRGGADALLFAAGEPRVRGVVTWASVADTMVPPDAERVVRERGYYGIENSRTGQTMPMARTIFDDAGRHDVEAAVRKLQVPMLLLHGTDDASVSLDHLDRLSSWAPDARTLRIEGAGHTFGAVHPFRRPTEHLEEAAEATIDFLLETHRPG
jgi:pimeloyl-ACP methyl ester carboxylesterase